MRRLPSFASTVAGSICSGLFDCANHTNQAYLFKSSHEGTVQNVTRKCSVKPTMPCGSSCWTAAPCTGQGLGSFLALGC